ncbi:MAG: family 16 glycoside hydrolase [Thermoguttaceae bacterium]
MKPTIRPGILKFLCAASGLLVVLAPGWPAAVGRGAEDEGFKPIFDGKTLEGWDGDPRFWRVEQDAITGQTTPENPTKGNTFLIWRHGELDDFELKAEFRIFGGNSGIQYRSWEQPDRWGKWVVGGYQADIDSSNTFTGANYGERFRGMLAARGQKTVIGNDHKARLVGQTGDPGELAAVVKKEDWNEYHIIARGFQFTHKINGRVMSEVTDEDAQARRRSGILALQLHAGPPMKVQFRDIRLKRLKMEQSKKIVLVAGGPSHGYGFHAHYAGCALLARLLNQNVPGVHAVVYRGGWPKDPTALDNADAVAIFSDGGAGHPALPHLDQLDKLMKQGVGLALLHYAVEIPKGRPGNCLLDWVGGYFETYWSVNPFWKAEFKSFPDHPVARGLQPFAIDDEWYYHMRFRENMQGLTPILTAVPPNSTRQRPDGPHSNNPTVRARKGMPEHVAWAFQRPDGGRGFGFTGGHYHWNWAHDGFRTVVLNGLVWVAGLDVPAGGVPSQTPTLDELLENQDFPPPKKFDPKRIQDLIDGWKQNSGRAK